MNLRDYTLFLLVMAGVTYLLRAIPFILLKGKIKSRFWRSFLSYVPYTVLAAMTVPAIFYSTNSMLSVEPSEAYNYVANEVRSMRTGYYAQTETRRLTPCWTVLTGTARFFFDLYDGTPLGFDLIGD